MTRTHRVRQHLADAIATATAAIWKAPQHERRAMVATLRAATARMQDISARLEEDRQ